MISRLESHLIDAINRFDMAHIIWRAALIEDRQADAETAYALVESAWNGVEGAWARLQVERQQAERQR